MSERMTEFFMLEALDYVDRLEQLSTADVVPSPEELRRVTRALRGVARLHGFTAIAEVAEALEHAAGGLRDGRLAWNEATRRRMADTVADLRTLVRGVRSWDGELAARAAAARARWVDGVPAAPRELEVCEPGDEGRVARYVAKELRALAEQLQGAVRRLESAPRDAEPLREVMRRVAPLAGAVWLDRFPVVCELVGALEAVSRWALARGRAVAGPWLEFYRVASRVADAAADTGGGVGEVPSLVRVRELAALLEGEGVSAVGEEVVPIESLFYDDGGPHILEYGGAAADREEVPVEVRNFFLIEATSLVDRAQGLLDEIVGRGEGKVAELEATLHELARTFGWFQFAETARVVRALAERAGSVASDRALAGSLEFAFPELRAVVEHMDQPVEVAERTRRMAEVLGVGEGAVAAGAAPQTFEAAAVARAPEEPSGVAAPEAAGPGEVVPITELLYSGPAALERAAALRSELDGALERGNLAAIEERLSEIFDLIELARS